MHKIIRKTQIIALFLAILLAAFACEPLEERLTNDAAAKLSFSLDTVYFDTVLTTVGSITKRFRVHNPNSKAVNISRIALGRGAASFFDLTINGQEAREAKDIRLLGNDSLLILATVTIDQGNQDLPFIVQDSVVFETNGNIQDVKLVAWGQDAHFLRNAVLDCESVWSGTKPYVIYDRVLVDTLCSLTIAQGTTVYMHNGAELFVKGSLHIEGSAEKPVIVSSVRQDEPYDRALGQWGAIVFLNGSHNNRIKHARISNGVFGLYLDLAREKPIDLVLTESVIENMGYAGLWAFGADVRCENVLIDNCLTHAVACLAGGNYQFDHCTFSNYSFDFFREQPLALFSNFVLLNNGADLLGGNLNVQLRNSILWGSLSEEVLFPSQWPQADSTITASNSIIRTMRPSIFKSATGVVFDKDPKFKDPRQQLFMLDTLSPAKDAGLLLGIQYDLLGKPRDAKPDLGAYERQE